MGKTYRRLAREKATIAIYQNLLVDASIDDLVLFIKEDQKIVDSEKTLEFCQTLIETTLNNKESYISLINKHLKKGWTFERLGMMEKAILLIATCEMLEFETPKQIAINEAVINAKKFCEDDAYKLINGVLSKVI
ncbi:MAG: transcription antitermination factor NusB [Erysipelotrichaceae bacterium]|nr:transcription antitermination factor NusB [Erysipelotrichaceae bacterium]